MDVNLKVGDKVRITCVMDDNETALGCNLVTGAQGTFALANLAFLDEWEARKDGVGVPARTPTVQSINSASQTPSSANVTNKDLTGSPDRLSAGQVLPSGLVVDRAMADLGRSDTLDTIAILNAEPSSSSTVPVGRYPTPPAATVSAAATPTTTSTTPTNYTHPVPAYATAVVDANSSLSTTPATSTRSTAPTTLTTSTPQIPGRYLAIKSYPSQSEMEVSLKLGDEVDVMFFAESGTTAFGLHVPSKQQGAFPASYLRKVPEPAGRRKDAAMIPMSAFAGMPGFGSGSGLGSSSSMGGSSSGMATGVVGSLSSTSTAAVNPYSADPVPQASSELPSRSTSLSGGTTPSSSSGGGPGGPTPTDYLSRNSTISHPPTRSTTVLERNESMGPHGPEGLLPPDPTADQARPLRQPITPSQQQSPYRDSVIAAIAALEEENAAAYKLYSDTIDRFRENGRPVPMAMNLELMKTLTNNMAQYSWDPETREERLRETAGSEDLNHPPTGTVVPPGHPLFNQHQHPQHAQQQNPNTHIPIMPRSTSFEGEIPAAAIEQLQQQQHAQNTKRTSIFRDRSGHAPYHVGALGASSGPLQNGKPSPPAVEQPPSAPVRLSDEQERRRKTLLSIIKELEFTEHNYCNDLKVLIDHMMVPMQNEPYVRKTDLDHIFRMIPQLSALSNIFSLELTDAVRQFDTNPFAVGAAFLGHVEEWSMYTQYVENYAMAKKTIRRLEDSPVHGTAFKEFLEKCRRTPECRRTDIHGFLILPIQRISRYWLLLQRMRKYCEDTPERETLEVAEHYMFEIGSMLDYVKRRDDETHRMFEIATEVKGFPANLISFTQRRFIGDYEAEEVTGAKRLILFLFSDALLVCTFRRQRDVQQDGKIYELQLQVDSKSMSVDVDEVDPSIIKLRFIECQPVSTGSVRLPARRADSTPIPPQPAQPPAPSSGGGGGIHLPSFRHSFMSTSSAASSTTSQVPLAHHNVIDGTLSRPLAPDEMFMMLLRFRDSRAHDTFLADVKKNEDMVARKRGKDAAASHPSTTESHPSLSVSSENTTSEQQQMKRRSMGDRQPSVFELTNGEEFLNELYYRGKVG
ncbi:hypothetical protein DFS34DRAFT_384253 [Phlyctochytrium arcticum]|nr:hypothetical protein DFS34DRAFT_384253 [Phlyctochytrium arcticum]